MTELKIRRIGSILKTNARGFLENGASIDKIDPLWRKPVETAVLAYQENAGNILKAIYLRGSVPKGTAVEGISDIDTFALVTAEVAQWLPPWRKDVQERISKLFPFVAGTEIILVSPSRLNEVKRLRNGWQRLIKTQAVCLWGEDICDSIAPFQPGPEMLAHAYSILAEIKDFEKGWGEHSFETKTYCTWIMKRVLRTGLELVMRRAQVYTRDLYPCYEIFSQFYPEYEPAMKRVLELAINPVEDKASVKNAIDKIGLLFESEIPEVVTI